MEIKGRGYAESITTTEQFNEEYVSITEKQQRISEILKTVNSALSQAEKIRKFIIADEPFTVSNKMLTPTLKVRRHEIYKITKN